MSSARCPFYTFGQFRLDPSERVLFHADQPVPLTPKALDLLLVLVQRHGHLVEKQELIRIVWPDAFVEENNLTQNISVLRKVLGNGGGGREFIETVPRRGYRFVAKVNEPVGVQDANKSASERGSRLRPIAAILGGTAPGTWVFRLAVVMLGVVSLLLILFAVRPRLWTMNSSGFDGFGQIQISRLTNSGTALSSVVSTDGRYVAHVLDDGGQRGLWLRHLATASSVALVPAMDVEYWGLTFSPDGSYIYYLAWQPNLPDAELFRVSALGGVSERLNHPGAISTAVSFAPDGARIVYGGGSPGETQLITATATGSEARVLATRKQPDGFWLFRSGPVWSPDGSAIACAAAVPGTQGAQMSIVVVQVSDGSERTIGSARWSRVGRIAWLPDGSGLIMTASSDRWSPWQIWHLSYPDGAARRLTNDINHYSDVSVTADGRMLVAVQAGGLASLWVGPSSQPTAAKRITSEVERYDGTEGIAWMPNGKLLHRTKLAGSWDIVLIDPESGGQQRVTFDASSELHPAVSADGRQLVFSSDRSGRFHLWRTSLERGEVVQLTDGPDEEVYPEISRDGQWIVYQEGFAYFKKASIWRVLATGGKPQRLVPATTTIQPARGQYIRPAISPDGRLVAYFQLDHRRWAIAVTPLNGGPPIGTFEIPPTASRILRWSPDGGAVAYIVTSRRVSNVWVQPIAGGPAHPFTEFQADRIFDFAWSQDGKRLAILRGIEASDLVSIAVSQPR